MKCIVCGKKPKIMIRRGTDLCSEGCQSKLEKEGGKR